MCKNFNELEFIHFVVVTSDGTIFGCARENGHVYNFLIQRDGVHTQNGEQWLELDQDTAQIIRGRAHDAYGRTPIYRTNRLLID